MFISCMNCARIILEVNLGASELDVPVLCGISVFSCLPLSKDLTDGGEDLFGGDDGCVGLLGI